MTRIEIQARQEAELNRLVSMRMPSLDDSQPDELWKRNEERADAKRTNQGQFLAWALLLVSLVIGGGAAYVISVLAARAYDHAMDAQQRAYCQQLQMAQAPSLPDYCGEGTK
jgi:hypothetical protein